MDKNKKSLKYLFSSLALSSALIVSPLLANDKQPIEPDPIGLWKANMFDIVLSIDKCPETKLCSTIHWIAPNETKVYDYFSYIARKPYKPKTDIWGKKEKKSIISREQILEICGQKIKSKLYVTKEDPRHWKGEMYVMSPIFGTGMWANTDIRMINENRIDIKLQKFIFKERDTWKRIPKSQYNNYPKCSPPSLK